MSQSKRSRAPAAHQSVRRARSRADLPGEIARASADAAVVFVVGPAGMGKSTVLSGLALAEEQVVIDGAELTRTTALAEMQRALDDGKVVLVDGWEHVDGDKAIARWLASPRHPEARLVVAGRSRPGAALAAAAPSRDLVTIELPALTPHESETILRARGVPGDRHADLARRADGNPLALQLLSIHPVVDEPLALSAIIDRFVGGLPEGPERRALEALSFLPYANEEALLAIAEGATASAFGWLRRQSFVRAASTGLRVHEALADAVRRDLLWRRPAAVGNLIARILRTALAEVEGADAVPSPWEMDACLFLLGVSPFRDRSPLLFGRAPLEPVTAPLVPEAEALVAETYGPASAALLRGWLRDGPGVATFDASGRMTGLSVHLSGNFQVRGDPLLARLRAALPHERVAVLRVCIKRGAGFVPCDETGTMQTWTTERNWPLSPDFHYVTVLDDPSPWQGLMSRIGGELRHDLATDVGTTRVTPHINAFASPSTMLLPLVSFVGDVWPAPGRPEAPTPRGEEVALDVLEDEIRGALEALNDAHALGRTALATRLGESAAALRERLDALVAETDTMKPGGVVRRVLDSAYSGKYPTRETAAAACAMSLATWKRYKREGIARLAERLVVSRRERA